MQRSLLLIFSTLVLVMPSCASHGKLTPSNTKLYSQTASSVVDEARLLSEQSKNALSPDQKIHFANKGIKTADHCVKTFLKEAGCYFYRAVNTGLYYQASPIGYQKGLRRMVADAEKVIQLNPAYDGGGAYQILGNLYLKAPTFSLSKQGITQDLEKAKMYAESAMKINPQELGNRYLMAEILMEEEHYQQAHPLLQTVVRDYPKKKPFTWYDRTSWEAAKKLLSKAQKKLTK